MLAHTPELLRGAERILLIGAPTRIHPRWERFVIGAPVGEVASEPRALLPRLLTWKSRTRHFRANPRSLDYMTASALTLLERTGVDAEVNLLAAPGGPVTAELARRLGRVWESADPDVTMMSDDVRTQIRAERHDAAILLYRDAIGLGWERCDATIEALRIPLLLVLNGRGRCFALTTDARRLLRRRRRLERSWIPELGAAVSLTMVATALAAKDAVTGAARRGRARS